MKQLNRYQESQLEGFDYDTFSVFYKGDLDRFGNLLWVLPMPLLLLKQISMLSTVFSDLQTLQ